MTTETTDNPKPVDFTRIQETSDGDIEFEQELFAIYLEDCKERIGSLRDAVTAQDTTLLHREAHTIKGSSVNVGTTRLHEIAHQIESASAGDTALLQQKLNELESEFGRVQTAIETYLSAR